MYSATFILKYKYQINQKFFRILYKREKYFEKKRFYLNHQYFYVQKTFNINPKALQNPTKLFFPSFLPLFHALSFSSYFFSSPSLFLFHFVLFALIALFSQASFWHRCRDNRCIAWFFNPLIDISWKNMSTSVLIKSADHPK